jgi:hypothetical protein
MTALKASVSPASVFQTVGATERYTIGSFSDGLAYLITDRRTAGEQVLVGEAAFLFHRELQFMQMARSIAGSPIASRSWAESLDDLAESFFKPTSGKVGTARQGTLSDMN